jgi:hypothetical protein
MQHSYLPKCCILIYRKLALLFTDHRGLSIHRRYLYNYTLYKMVSDYMTLKAKVSNYITLKLDKVSDYMTLKRVW